MMRVLLLLLAGWTLWIPPSSAQTNGLSLSLTPTPNAAGLGLAGVTGTAEVVIESAWLRIRLQPNGAALPAGTVLEGWLVDFNSGSDADEFFAPAFLHAEADTMLETVPYALSVGVLSQTTWELIYQLPGGYNFSPYDMVLITAESDGSTNFDPRPGTPVFSADLATGQPIAVEVITMETLPSSGTPIPLALVVLPEIQTTAGFPSVTASATIYADSADFLVNLGGAALPADTVLEAWLVDDGLIYAGLGVTSVSDADEAWGVPFGDAALDVGLENNYYALSLGFLTPDGSGNYSLNHRLSNYNFSPYDAVVVTLETGGLVNFDPRPGSPLAFAQMSVPAAAPPVVSSLPAWQTVTLTDVRTGAVFTLADFAGKTVVIEPMATWCTNCRRQLSDNLLTAYNSVGDDVVFVALSVEPGINAETLANYANNNNFPYIFALAPDTLLQALADQFGQTITDPSSTPHFILYPDGTFTDLLTGPTHFEDLLALINRN